MTPNKNKSIAKKKRSIRNVRSGFALIISLAIMTFIVMLILSLSSFVISEIKLGNAAKQQHLARMHAKYSLTVAISTLQEEMGPDMRITAESAIFDKKPETEEIDGVAQSHWLASYNSWGNWLNAQYELPDGGSTLKIQDTYVDEREPMFRRWLLSMPEGYESLTKAVYNIRSWNDSNSIILVGKGSIGNKVADDHPDRVTRAYLRSIGEEGKYAWWIGPENHKVDANYLKEQKHLSFDELEVAHGNTPKKGIEALEGFKILEKNADKLINRIITPATLGPADIDVEKIQEHFYDITSGSKGVLASVRTGALKKDLSLLFEQEKVGDPMYDFTPGSVREPSIRPMSSELLSDNNVSVPERHFASWTNMRQFYRMYHETSHSAPKGDFQFKTKVGPDAQRGGTLGKQTKADSAGLNWDGPMPWTDVIMPTNVGIDQREYSGWSGENVYLRAPILARGVTILATHLISEDHGKVVDPPAPAVVVGYAAVYWNPYNVEMRIKSGSYVARHSHETMPYNHEWVDGGGNPAGYVDDETGEFVILDSYGTTDKKLNIPLATGVKPRHREDWHIFKPGEFKVFMNYELNEDSKFLPEFNSAQIGGMYSRRPIVSEVTGLALRCHFNYELVAHGGTLKIHNAYGGNSGSFKHRHSWQNGNRQRHKKLTGEHLNNLGLTPMLYNYDWIQDEHSKSDITEQPMAMLGVKENQTVPGIYKIMSIKGAYAYDTDEMRGWGEDWRNRNWLHSPPFYFGGGMFISEDDKIAHTQRLDSPYMINWGTTDDFSISQVMGLSGGQPYLGSGVEDGAFERVTAAPMLELPTAPVSSLAGFSGMRINPGWVRPDIYQGHVKLRELGDHEQPGAFFIESKAIAYQSGITGPGIGNSFIHPMINRTKVHRNLDNSVSYQPAGDPPGSSSSLDAYDHKMYRDYWDHVLLLNDALWDDYFVSSIADQTRAGTGKGDDLQKNIDRLINGVGLANSRYIYHSTGDDEWDIKNELSADDGYMKAARHLMVDGMFNVNSTSVAAWYALFSSISSRMLSYRNSDGSLEELKNLPAGKSIVLSRFNTPNSTNEVEDYSRGVRFHDDSNALKGWTGIRYLSEDQLMKLAEECVEQVKKRGPFLNFSEFINRRLSNDDLGLMGALQSAIDYDDDSPESGSINYQFKSDSELMIGESDLGINTYETPEAAVGSRLAGIPGYVIQSDLLKPIANTLSVRDDTFKVRAYGEVNDSSGQTIAKAWCEAVLQRIPEYYDSNNEASEPFRIMDNDGEFKENKRLSEDNNKYGRKFKIVSFRWLQGSDV